ncbi:hypothetical protein C8Q74DRAFT_141532 [Fomes fomentarius]|nr:hypothetical protein C8Q74DRAFT_141532 [Fomes fomentarius]
MATSPDALNILPVSHIDGTDHIFNEHSVRSSLLNTLNETNHIDTNSTSGPKPFHLITDDVSLFSRSFPYPQIANHREMNLGVEGSKNGTVDYGAVVIMGTIVPPNITVFGLYVGLDATINGTLDLDASLTVYLC